jgi:hypothetical protein
MMNNQPPQEVWDHDLRSITRPAADWLLHGLIARGNLTLLTSLWKAGKTTLLALLLSRRKHGGLLAGLAVQPGKTVVITEEDSALWADRARRYDFGGQVCFFPRPFHAIPTPAEWQALIDRIRTLHQQHGIDMVVIDPLAPFLRGENHPKHIFDALLPLNDLTRLGMACLALHHPSKGEPRIGCAARGSGALLGHVDISIEMRHPGGDPLTRRRRFFAFSRHAETPRRLLLELNADATDYLPVTDESADSFESNWEVLRLVLDDAPQKLTRLDILDSWPADFNKPNAGTLCKWLNLALERSLIAREGTGRKTDPFRFWLPEREEVWKQHPLYEVIERQRRELNLPFQSLRERQSKLANDTAIPQDLPEE